VLDGFPRNISQAKALDLMIAEQGHTLDHVVSLDVDESILKERIEYRIKESGANRRSDDTEHTLYRRLSIYREQTRPLEHYYEQQGLLRRVDGMKPIDTITGELYEIVTGRKAA
jgi:adenylate kinase